MNQHLQRLKTTTAPVAHIGRSAPVPGLTPTVDGLVRRVLDQHGPAAFELPWNAAIAHECGHAIVGAHEGLDITSVRITAVAGAGWSGCCDEAGPWSCGPHTSVEADLSRARMTVAGLVGEFVMGLDRPGSSLDEWVLSQSILAGVAAKLGHPDDDAALLQLWHTRVWSEALRILRDNKMLFCELAGALGVREVVKGKKLREILRRVKRRGTTVINPSKEIVPMNINTGRAP